jgi:hypothetical protein
MITLNESDTLAQLEVQLADKVARFQKELDAVRMTRALIAKKPYAQTDSPNESQGEVQHPRADSTGKPVPYGNIASSVRSIVDKRSSGFTIADVEQELKAKGIKFFPSTVRAAVTRMIKHGSIKVAERGSGRSPSTYARI